MKSYWQNTAKMLEFPRLSGDISTDVLVIGGLISGNPVEYSPLFSPSRSIWKPQLFINGFESAKGLLTPTTRRCPHLGCALHYNREEHSWDCACHGSRFSEDGKVLNNPASDDGKPK